MIIVKLCLNYALSVYIILNVLFLLFTKHPTILYAYIYERLNYAYFNEGSQCTSPIFMPTISWSNHTQQPTHVFFIKHLANL